MSIKRFFFLFFEISSVFEVYCQEITFCHFSDIHSVFNETQHDSGGLSAIHAAIRTKCPENRILTFGGDFLDHTDLQLAEVESKMLNELQVDFYTFGNHEFDDAENILTLYSNSSLIHSKPVISNLSGPIKDELGLPKYRLSLAPGGIPVCFFGLLPLDTEETSSPTFASTFLPYKASIRKAVEQCEDEFLFAKRHEWIEKGLLHKDYIDKTETKERFSSLSSSNLNHYDCSSPPTSLNPADLHTNNYRRPMRVLLSHVGLKFDSYFYSWEEPSEVLLERFRAAIRRQKRLDKHLNSWAEKQGRKTIRDFTADEIAELLPQPLVRLRKATIDGLTAVRAAQEELYFEMPEIDLVLGAHSHTVTPAPLFVDSPSGLKTIVVHAGHHSISLGIVKFKIESSSSSNADQRIPSSFCQDTRTLASLASSRRSSFRGSMLTFNNSLQYLQWMQDPASDYRKSFDALHRLPLRPPIVFLSEEPVVGMISFRLFHPVPVSPLFAQLPVWSVPHEACPPSTDALVKRRLETKLRIYEEKRTRAEEETRRLIEYGLLPPPFTREFFSPVFLSKDERKVGENTQAEKLKGSLVERQEGREISRIYPSSASLQALKSPYVSSQALHLPLNSLAVAPFGLRSTDVRERSNALGRLVGDGLAKNFSLSLSAAWQRLLTAKKGSYKERAGVPFLDEVSVAKAMQNLQFFAEEIQDSHLGVIALQPAGNVRRPLPSGVVDRAAIERTLPLSDEERPLKWLSVSAARVCDIMQRGFAHVSWKPPARAPAGVHRKGSWPIFGNIRGWIEVDPILKKSDALRFELRNQMDVSVIHSWNDQDGVCPNDSPKGVIDRIFECDDVKDFKRLVNTRVVLVTCDFVASGGDGLLAGIDGRRIPMCFYDEKGELKMKKPRSDTEIHVEEDEWMDICEIETPAIIGRTGGQGSLEMYLRWLGGGSVWGESVPYPRTLQDDHVGGGGGDGRYIFSSKTVE
eukprot:GDKJ01017441.1.p1 GENE.GDKJ01017441.1~~GDKJ01017441.1.p1  ORF type:complete len:974 (+),score=155.25 GDKJ01017441.1:43-2964(+)